MLTIGRFADATGRTAKALRHYDEIGLLVPARVDPENGYRYHDAAQIVTRCETDSRRTAIASRRRCGTSTAC